MNVARRVVKLGGSLLDWPPVWSRVDAWLRQQGPAETLIVVGGGALADAIRTLDRTFGLDALATHRWCVRAMSIHAEIAVHLLPGAALLARLDDRPANTQIDRRWIVEPIDVVERCDRARSAEPLPPSWDVTSDSIAARVAELCGAEELTLLKSTLPPSDTIAECSGAGYIDPYLVHIAGNLPSIRCVDLRDDRFSERILQA